MPELSAQTRAADSEFLNTASHGAGLLAALAGLPILVLAAVRGGGPADVVGSAVFGASLILLYLASTAYHGAPAGRRKDLLQKLDHAAIYVLIAGTYTPFTLGVLSGPWGWSLLGTVWAAAAMGIAAKLAVGMRYPKLSTAFYLVMGWLVIIALKPLVSAMPAQGLSLLAAGGLFYSAGVAFYINHTLRHAHFIWHLFVLAGSTCHYLAVLWHAR